MAGVEFVSLSKRHEPKQAACADNLIAHRAEIKFVLRISSDRNTLASVMNLSQ